MGTTNPESAIKNKLRKIKSKNAIGDKEKDPNRKTGSKYGKRKRAKMDPKPHLNRKSAAKKSSKNKKDDSGVNEMSDISNATRYLIENHGMPLHGVVASFNDPSLLSKVAQKCMTTCLSGWSSEDGFLVSENTDLQLSCDSWDIAEDGSAQLKNGFKFDYDWLYELSNSTISEDVDVINEQIEDQELDPDTFSDTLSNASSLLRKMSDKEVKKYILNAAQGGEININNLRKVLEETGVNWKFVGAEVDGDKINLSIKVKYSVDGTQDGVVEKKLSVEVKPSADVREEESDVGDDELDLGFGSEEPIEGELETNEDAETTTLQDDIDEEYKEESDS
jgi:hypothetical protein